MNDAKPIRKHCEKIKKFNPKNITIKILLLILLLLQIFKLSVISLKFDLI
jgi:hypothetical protein